MQELEKILEEIEHQERICLEIDNSDEFNAGAIDMAISIKEIIRNHMNGYRIMILRGFQMKRKAIIRLIRKHVKSILWGQCGATIAQRMITIEILHTLTLQKT